MVKSRFLVQEANNKNLNIWPSFTDLMANAFMIISLFLLLALFKSLFLKYTAEETEINLDASKQQVRILKRQVAALENELSNRNTVISNRNNTIDRLSKTSSNLQALLQSSNERIEIVTAENQRLKSAPPVVLIQDSGEYQFASGSASLPEELQSYITTDLVNLIEQISQQNNLYVVEIIGHTDGQVNFNSFSNLDQQLEAVAQGKKSINSLTPGSNADLGLMRSLEVVKKLQEVQKQGRLPGVEFRAYSAAQLQLPSGEFASENRQPNARRRRIEIRFSPLGKAETIR
ncbi:MAG: flagellar motor protein [Xenococcus sp. MO_188.B8]|nr:flagellar motor protein [Xenococcus sp. MO_188.B8]